MTTPLTRTFAAALESLQARDRQVLALHEVDGLSTDGIGTLLDIPPAQARIELRHARLAMLRSLSGRPETVAA